MGLGCVVNRVGGEEERERESCWLWCSSAVFGRKREGRLVKKKMKERIVCVWVSMKKRKMEKGEWGWFWCCGYLESGEDCRRRRRKERGEGCCVKGEVESGSLMVKEDAKMGLLQCKSGEGAAEEEERGEGKNGGLGCWVRCGCVEEEDE